MILLTTNLFLVTLLLISILGKNQLVSISAGCLLMLRLLNFTWIMPHIEEAGIRVGLTVLVLSILAPLAGDAVPIKSVLGLLTSPPGIAAVIGGVAGAYLGAEGLDILQKRPESILGLVVGTILGATFLRGIPVGPLVAAGLAAVFLKLLGFRF